MCANTDVKYKIQLFEYKSEHKKICITEKKLFPGSLKLIKFQNSPMKSLFFLVGCDDQMPTGGQIRLQRFRINVWWKFVRTIYFTFDFSELIGARFMPKMNDQAFAGNFHLKLNFRQSLLRVKSFIKFKKKCS